LEHEINTEDFTIVNTRCLLSIKPYKWVLSFTLRTEMDLYLIYSSGTIF